LRPDIEVLAPAQTWGMSGEEEREYARARHVPVPASSGMLDVNLWSRTIEGTPPGGTTRAASVRLEIAFERGIPTAVNGVSMGLVELIESLTTIAGGEGVGRVRTQPDPAGAPTICEAPAALVLDAAHRELEARVTAPEVGEVKRTLAATYAELVRTGLWFSPLREAIDAFTAKIQENVTGVVGLTLANGICSVTTTPQPSFATHS
jgi:argininosuccinate synthase